MTYLEKYKKEYFLSYLGSPCKVRYFHEKSCQGMVRENIENKLIFLTIYRLLCGHSSLVQILESIKLADHCSQIGRVGTLYVSSFQKHWCVWSFWGHRPWNYTTLKSGRNCKSTVKIHRGVQPGVKDPEKTRSKFKLAWPLSIHVWPWGKISMTPDNKWFF